MSSLIAYSPAPSPLPEIEIEARAEISKTKGLLTFSFLINGDVESLLFQQSEVVGRHDELWKHTCFEGFLQPIGGPTYIEFNMAPSGSWNSYLFESYRDGMRADSRITGLEEFSFRATVDEARLECAIDLSAIVGSASGFRLGLAAVIETKLGEKSYWALNHPADKPDFHDHRGFQLELSTSAIRN